MWKTLGIIGITAVVLLIIFLAARFIILKRAASRKAAASEKSTASNTKNTNPDFVIEKNVMFVSTDEVI